VSRKTEGLTVIEVVLVVAVLGVLLGIGFTRISPPSARLLSGDLKSMLYQARYEAVKRNQPVAFVWDPTDETFYVRLDTASPDVSAQCGGEATLVVKRVAEYPGADVRVDIASNGVVWLPNGQGRSCTGAPMVAGEIAVSSGSVERLVVITMGGKVSIE